MDRGRFNLLSFFILTYRLSDRVWFRMVGSKWGGRGYLVRAVGGWVKSWLLLCALLAGELGLGLVGFFGLIGSLCYDQR